MKKNLIALSIGAALSCSVSADVVITEYVEGGSYNKAIELYNTGPGDVDLSTYKLVMYKDGSTSATDMVSLSGTMAAEKIIVVRNYDKKTDSKTGTLLNLDEAPLSTAIDDGKLEIITNSKLSFNGGDAVALQDGGSDVDVFGIPGQSTVDMPKVGETTFKDQTWRRYSHTPTTTFDTKDWEKYNKDDISGLGLVDAATTPPEAVVPVPTSATIQEIQGPGSHSTIGGIDVGTFEFDSGDNYFEVTGIVTAIQTSALGSDLPKGFFMQNDGDDDDQTSDGIFVETSKIDELEKGTNVTVVAKVKEHYDRTQLFEVYSVETSGTSDVPEATPIRVLDTDVDEDNKADFKKTLERYEGMLIEMDEEADLRISRTFGYDHGSKRNNLVVAHGAVNMHPNQMNVPGSPEAAAQTASNENRRMIVESFAKAGNGEVPWYPDFATESQTLINDSIATTDDYLRIGDTLDGLEGVLSYSYKEYRVFVTNEATKETFIHNIPRTDSPVIERGDLRIGTMNVLNYFNSPFGGDCNPMEDSDESTGCNNRGATTQADFEVQGDKIAAAIVALDADILGLMEIENNGFGSDSAVAHLVDKVNALIPNRIDHYQFVKGNEDDKFVGTDAIANQVIFRPTKVQMETYRLIKMPSQKAPEVEKDGKVIEDGENYQRDTITPTFVVKGSEPAEKVTVAVNHFKSKGSKCWEDAASIADGGQDEKDADKQGSCENFRVSAAKRLGDELEKIEGSKLILGDLNSYASEDAILLLTTMPDGHSVKPARNTYIGDDEIVGDTPEAITSSFGYVNVAKEKHPDKFSYSYNDEVGTLDYILVDKSLMSKVIDATEWNINAAESTLFEYPSKYSGDMLKYKDMYSSSDHDPAVITLNLGDSVKKNTKPVIEAGGKPQEKPEGAQEVPKNPKPGEKLNVLFDLTSLGIDLHDGDKVVVSFDKVQDKAKTAATEGGSTTTVTLDEPMINKGWVEVEAEVSEAGDYQMTKQVIDGETGETVYLSEAQSMTVAESSTSSSSGGSLGWLSILGLFGFGLFRRRRA